MQGFALADSCSLIAFRMLFFKAIQIAVLVFSFETAIRSLNRRTNPNPGIGTPVLTRFLSRLLKHYESADCKVLAYHGHCCGPVK